MSCSYECDEWRVRWRRGRQHWLGTVEHAHHAQGGGYGRELISRFRRSVVGSGVVERRRRVSEFSFFRRWRARVDSLTLPPPFNSHPFSFSLNMCPSSNPSVRDPAVLVGIVCSLFARAQASLCMTIERGRVATVRPRVSEWDCCDLWERITDAEVLSRRAESFGAESAPFARREVRAAHADEHTSSFGSRAPQRCHSLARSIAEVKRHSYDRIVIASRTSKQGIRGAHHL